MADKVMRMPTPASPVPDGKLQRQEEEEVQRQEEEEVQRQEAPEEEVQRQEEEEVQRQEAPEEEVQRQEEEEVQRQEAPEEEVQRQEEEKIQEAPAADEKLQRKGNGTPAVHADTQSSIQNKIPEASYFPPIYAAIWNRVLELISVTCASTVTPNPLA